MIFGRYSGENPDLFTIVEIGAGRSPILTNPDTPDVARLYHEGGNYIAIDANADDIQSGAQAAAPYQRTHRKWRAKLHTSFEHGIIEPDEPLPSILTPDSADRVILGNVLTDPRVARTPDLCEALASAAMQLVRKSPIGEVVVIGTLTPRVFPADATRVLMEKAGLEYAGSDRLVGYIPTRCRKVDSQSYVDRYRPAGT